jgi:hypothetical protein
MILKHISTAPKDGTIILALTTNALEQVRFSRVRFNNGRWRYGKDSHVELQESFILWTENHIEEEKAPEPPKPVLVPLGPNKTRDGRTVHVRCIDAAKPGYPVIAEVPDPHSKELILTYYTAEGVSRSSKERDRTDLVGHLPPAEPEPVKPREWWINICEHRPEFFASKEDADEAACNSRKECRHVREVLPGEQDELEALRLWKKAQLLVEDQWDPHAVGKELGLTLGSKIRPAILPKIREYKDLLDRALRGLDPQCHLAGQIRKALNP